jgi:hypothetical protein
MIVTLNSEWGDPVEVSLVGIDYKTGEATVEFCNTSDMQCECFDLDELSAAILSLQAKRVSWFDSKK